MKKIVAILLALIFLLSLTACGTGGKNDTTTDTSEPVASVTSTTTQPESNEETETTDIVDTTSSDTTIEGVSSFDDFVERTKKSGYKTTETKTEDGNIIVEMETPTTNTDDDSSIVTPVIPTIEVVKPTVPTPSEPEKSEETSSNDTSDTTSFDNDETEEPTEPSSPSVPEEPKKPEYTYTTGQTHTKVHYTDRYLYSILNAEQKEWYRKIDVAVNNLQEEVTLGADMTANNNYYIYYLYVMDNPEHFYLVNRVMVRSNQNGQGGLMLYYAVSNVKGEYCGYGYGSMSEELKNKIKEKKATFENEVNRILSTIPANAPEVWKEKLIYDRILMDCKYNLSARWDGLANDNWTAYGIIINKTGVCESYSEAFQTLCLYAGINCTGVSGTAGGGHKWNCVELDGEWYMCDITFDDPVGSIQGETLHYYFNLTSAKMQELSHDWSNSEWPVPECTATKYSYDNYF